MVPQSLPKQVLSGEFDEFDRLIRPDKSTLEAAKQAHLDVRQRLNNDKYIAEIHVADFLQGSYARHTMVHPADGEDGQPGKADVDIVFVTKVPETVLPEHILQALAAWLAREYGQDRVTVQSRSVKVAFNDVDVDLVPTSAPSEAQQELLVFGLMDIIAKAYSSVTRASGSEDDVHDPNEVFGPMRSAGAWTKESLRIPDRDAKCWQDTHPLAALDFTAQRNKACNRRFLRVVRALKWWRRVCFQTGRGKHPKSYPIEHMVGDCCPLEFDSMAEGLTLTLERMRDVYKEHYRRSKPTLRPRGLEDSEADVLSRLSQEDFDAFFEDLETAATQARYALHHREPREAARAWQRLLGEEFKVPPAPRTPSSPPSGGFPPREQPAPRPTGGRFG